MTDTKYYCSECLKNLDHIADGKAGRTEACPHCSADLHACNNCKFYDLSSYNECREPQAERVLEKKKSNFCDYFTFQSGERTQKSAGTSKAEQLKKLDDLFK